MLLNIRRPRHPGRRDDVPMDPRGRPRGLVTLPGYKAGLKPPNAGLSFPAEVLTPDEIARLLTACPRRGAAGLRNRALIVLLWRGGLRCQEALDLELRDVDEPAGTITVRHGKGNRRRVVGLDPPAFAILERWLAERRRLGVPRGARVFCTITKGNIGRPLGAAYWREAIKRLGIQAGIEKRVHSHGLRHTHAAELAREKTSIVVISRQLGHASIRMTQRYVDHLEPQEVVEVMQHRDWPIHEGLL
ncbi:MAG TPA: site-specific integrase [Opitutaceae bacterium]|nr:site-specific integrase [Opitutaceae bacterium]